MRIRTISDADLNRIPKSPLLLKGTGPEVYLVEGASRQRIPTRTLFAAMGLDLGAILEIGNAQLSGIPEGAPIDRPRGPIPPPPQNVSIGGGPAAPATTPAASVTVQFHNPGLAVMDIYSVAPDGAERRWGGIAPKSTTIQIPTRAGELWRFRLSPTARSNNSVRDEYRATADPEQRHAVPGFLNNAEDPSPSVISQVLAELVRNVEARRQEAGRVINSLGSPRLPTNCRPGTDNQAGVCYPACPAGRTGVGPMCWPQLSAGEVNRITNDLRTKANSLAATYRGEIEVGLEHLRMLSATTPNLIPMARAASERGDRRAVAQLLQLDRLVAGIRARRQVARGQDAVPAWQFQRAAWLGAISPLSGGVNALRSSQASGAQYIVSFAPLVLDLSLVAGGSYEAGMGWEIDGQGSRGPDWSYKSWSWTAGLSVGANYSVNVGLLFGGRADFDGASHGVTFGGAAGVGGTITFWFSHRGNFSGLTLTPSTGVSAEAEYVRSTTNVH